MAAQKLLRRPGYPFYKRLNQVLERAGFEAFVEGLRVVNSDGSGSRVCTQETSMQEL